MQYIEGIKTDCENLLHRFQAIQDVRFEKFSHIWREMKFTLLFCGHEDEKEVMEFTEDCFFVLTTFCLPPYSFQWRTGSLYALYALYFKQPTLVKAKIRVTSDQWLEIINLVDWAKSEEHLDIHYVFLKLEFDKAFYFVASPMELAPKYRDSQSTMEFGKYFSETSQLKDIVDDGQLEDLAVMQRQYEAAKNGLASADYDSLNLTSKDFIPGLFAKVKAFEEMRGNVGLKLHMFDDSDEDYSDRDADYAMQDVGARRKNIKKKIMSVIANQSKSRRHRQVDLHDASPTKSVSPQKKRQNRKVKKAIALQSEDSVGDDPTALSEEINPNVRSMPHFSEHVVPIDIGVRRRGQGRAMAPVHKVRKITKKR